MHLADKYREHKAINLDDQADYVEAHEQKPICVVNCACVCVCVCGCAYESECVWKIGVGESYFQMISKTEHSYNLNVT